MPNSETDKLVDAVDEIVKHGHDNLPVGPSSPLGGEARPNLLTTRTEPEIKRLAKLGKALVDKRISARTKHAG